MKTLLSFFLVVIAVAAITSFATLHWVSARPPAAAHAHEWLHRELNLTDAQQAALEPVEARFAAQQVELNARLRSANRELARLMGEDKAYTRRVAEAVEAIHQDMGLLQKASIEHVFEMRTVLNPDQGERLLHFAQQGLDSNP